MWIRAPTNEKQRERWLAIADIVDKFAIRTLDELIAALKERNVGASRTTVLSDIRNLNIDRFNGIYMRVPITQHDELRAVLRARMRVVVEGVFSQGNIVVINTNHGASPWVALVIREMNDPEILSVLTDSEGMSIWLLAAEGKTRSVYGRLTKIWRE